MVDVVHVPARLVIGADGRPAVARGHTDVGGLRIEHDLVVVGAYGQPVISRGRTFGIGHDGPDDGAFRRMPGRRQGTGGA